MPFKNLMIKQQMFIFFLTFVGICLGQFICPRNLSLVSQNPIFGPSLDYVTNPNYEFGFTAGSYSQSVVSVDFNNAYDTSMNILPENKILSNLDYYENIFSLIPFENMASIALQKFDNIQDSSVSKQINNGLPNTTRPSRKTMTNFLWNAPTGINAFMITTNFDSGSMITWVDNSMSTIPQINNVANINYDNATKDQFNLVNIFLPRISTVSSDKLLYQQQSPQSGETNGLKFLIGNSTSLISESNMLIMTIRCSTINRNSIISVKNLMIDGFMMGYFVSEKLSSSLQYDMMTNFSLEKYQYYAGGDLDFTLYCNQTFQKSWIFRDVLPLKQRSISGYLYLNVPGYTMTQNGGPILQTSPWKSYVDISNSVEFVWSKSMECTPTHPMLYDSYQVCSNIYCDSYETMSFYYHANSGIPTFYMTNLTWDKFDFVNNFYMSDGMDFNVGIPNSSLTYKNFVSTIDPQTLTTFFESNVSNIHFNTLANYNSLDDKTNDPIVYYKNEGKSAKRFYYDTKYKCITKNLIKIPDEIGWIQPNKIFMMLDYKINVTTNSYSARINSRITLDNETSYRFYSYTKTQNFGPTLLYNQTSSNLFKIHPLLRRVYTIPSFFLGDRQLYNDWISLINYYNGVTVKLEILCDTSSITLNDTFLIPPSGSVLFSLNSHPLRFFSNFKLSSQSFLNRLSTNDFPKIYNFSTSDLSVALQYSPWTYTFNKNPQSVDYMFGYQNMDYQTCAKMRCPSSTSNIVLLKDPGLIIKSIYTNPSDGLSDANREFVILAGTKNFSLQHTPYSVFFTTFGSANSLGIRAGGTTTYAFDLNNGNITEGHEYIVGGSNILSLPFMINLINAQSQYYSDMTNYGYSNISSKVSTIHVLKLKDTKIEYGDDNIGNPSNFGILGNGGTSADGVVVYDFIASSVVPSYIPVDAIFYGKKWGNTILSYTNGLQLPINDLYNGGKIQSTNYLVTDAIPSYILTSIGKYSSKNMTFSGSRFFWWRNPVDYIKKQYIDIPSLDNNVDSYSSNLFINEITSKYVSILSVTCPPNIASLAKFAVLTFSPSLTFSTSSTIITGDVGANSSVSCPGSCTIVGTINLGNSNYTLAKNDATNLNNYLLGLPCTTTSTATTISSPTYTSGVYCYTSTSTITFSGTITMDALGNSDAIFVFIFTGSTTNVRMQAGTTVVMGNNAQTCNVFWNMHQYTTFSNVVMAGTVVTRLTGGANTASNFNMNGRVICMSVIAGSCDLSKSNTAVTNCQSISCSCSPGYFYNGSSCQACSVGYYSPGGYAVASCTICPSGTFSNTTASPNCTTCPLGSQSGSGSSVCQQCPVNYYNNVSGGSCLPCPIDYSTNGQTGQTYCTEIGIIFDIFN